MSLLLLPLSPRTLRVIFVRENTIWSRNSVKYFDAADRDNGERSGDINNVAKDYESCVIFECDQAYCLTWMKLKSPSILSNVENRGKDPTKAKHQHMTMVIKFFSSQTTHDTFQVSRRKNIESKLVMFPLQNSSSLLTPKSYWHLISSYSISPESHIKVRRIKEIITTDRAHDC